MQSRLTNGGQRLIDTANGVCQSFQDRSDVTLLNLVDELGSIDLRCHSARDRQQRQKKGRPQGN